MSTKNISRTALEPGRDGWYKQMVKDAQRIMRTETRAYLREVIKDPELADDVTDPKLGVVSKKGFQKDKLGPIKKYLKSKVGQPWNEIFSEINEKFDGNTLAGRHILEHIQHYITGLTPKENIPNDESKDYFFGCEFSISENGILIDNPFRLAKLERLNQERKIRQREEDFIRIANKRKVFRDVTGRPHWEERYDNTGVRIFPHHIVTMTEEEIEFFNSLTLDQRARLSRKDNIRKIINLIEKNDYEIIKTRALYNLHYEWNGFEQAEIYLGFRSGVLEEGIPSE